MPGRRRIRPKDESLGPEAHLNYCQRHPITVCFILTLILVTSLLVILGLSVLSQLTRLSAGARPTTSTTNFTLTQGSDAAASWGNETLPRLVKFYFFNLMNPDEVKNGGAKPMLEEVGPFVYRENRTKFNLTWNDDGTVVHYNLNISYTWDEKLSVADPKDVQIMSINMPLINVLSFVESQEEGTEVLKFLLRSLETTEGIFVNRTVEQLLWGYEDPLLKDLLDGELVPSNVFSFLSRRKTEAPNAIFTGKDKECKTGEYVEWNGRTSISEWGTPTAQMINGTDGNFFHPNVSKEDCLVTFVSQLLRSIHLSYEEDVTNNGVTLSRFTIPEEELCRVMQDPGFYPNGPSGVFNLTAVSSSHLPLFASKPHFLDADAGYLRNVSGLKPNRTLHDSYWDVEPKTGAVPAAAKRFQLNIRLHSNTNVPSLEILPYDTMLPIFYSSEEWAVKATAVDSGGSEGECNNDTTRRMLVAAMIILTSISIIFSVAGIIIWCYMLQRMRQLQRADEQQLDVVIELESDSDDDDPLQFLVEGKKRKM